MKIFYSLAIMVSFLIITGCGQKGDLMRPAPVTSPATALPATDSSSSESKAQPSSTPP